MFIVWLDHVHIKDYFYCLTFKDKQIHIKIVVLRCDVRSLFEIVRLHNIFFIFNSFDTKFFSFVLVEKGVCTVMIFTYFILSAFFFYIFVMFWIFKHFIIWFHSFLHFSFSFYLFLFVWTEQNMRQHNVPNVQTITNTIDLINIFLFWSLVHQPAVLSVRARMHSQTK